MTAADGLVWAALTAGLAAALILIAREDRRALRIPDALSLPLIAAGPVLCWALPGAMPAAAADAVLGAAGGFALFALVGEAHFRLRGREGLGVGDAKLFAAAGGWLGWQALPLVLLIAAGGALAWLAAQGAARRGRPVAFGPWIALGWAVIWLAAPLAGR